MSYIKLECTDSSLTRERNPNVLWGFLILFGALLVAGAHGQIYVVNSRSGTIGEYDLSGTTINARLISGLQTPTGLAIAGEDLYVAQENGIIRHYTTSGTLVDPALITGLHLPWGIAVSGGYLYVANAGGESSTVGKYTTSGVAVNEALITGLGNPTGLAVAGDELYVSEWHNGRVGKYTTTGATVNRFLISGLTYPGGLALDGSGHLFVSSHARVGVYTTSGTTVNASLISDGFNSGVGLALDGHGHLFWANNYGGVGGNRIAEYTTSGEAVNLSLITALNNPVAMVVVPEITPPTIFCPEPLFLECMDGSAVGTVQVEVMDTNGLPLEVIWTVDGTAYQTNDIPSGGAITSSNVTFTADFVSGEHTVVVSASNGQAAPVSCSTTVTVSDTLPPTVLAISATPDLLWPPNHRMIPVNVTVIAVDDCDPSPVAHITQVTSNGPQNPFAPDWEITGPLSVNLRAERLGDKGGRIYTIDVECEDSNGNVVTESLEVAVAHDHR